MSSTTLHFQLTTPVKTLFEHDVTQVTLPTPLGDVTILPHHVTFVSILSPGELIVVEKEKKIPLAVSGGIIEVQNNTLMVLADSAEHFHEIDIAETERRAQELAKQLRAETQLDLKTYSLLQKQLAAEHARLEVARKWRR